MNAGAKWWLRASLLLLLGVGLLWLAYYLRDILNPLLAALAIAYALNPLVVNLSKRTLFGRPMGRTGATVLIFVGFLAVFGGTLALAIPMIGREVAALAGDMAGEPEWDTTKLRTAIINGEFEPIPGAPLPDYTRSPNDPPWTAQERLADSAADPANVAALATILQRRGRVLTRAHDTADDGSLIALDSWFIDHNGNRAHDAGHLRKLNDWMTRATGKVWSTVSDNAVAKDHLDQFRASTTEKLQARSGELAATGFSAVGWVGSALAESARAVFVMLSVLVLIPFYTFFFMRGLDQAALRTIPYIPAAIRPKTVRICTRIHMILSAFIRGRAFIAAVVTVMAWLGFWACGVPYALVLGILTGITIMVPFLPVVVAVIPACLLLLAEGKGIGPIAGVIIVYSIIQTIEGFVLTPRVLGEEGDMHPVAAFVAVFVGAELLGLLGAMLAIPLAAAVKIIAQELLMPELKDIAGMGPGTETGKTIIAMRAGRAGLESSGGLVPHPLDAPAPADAGAGAAPSRCRRAVSPSTCRSARCRAPHRRADRPPPRRPPNAGSRRTRSWFPRRWRGHSRVRRIGASRTPRSSTGPGIRTRSR